MTDKRISSTTIELQTPGAGPSRQRSRPPDILVPPPQAYLETRSNDAASVRARTPTRTDTLHEDVELGIYLRPDGAGPTTGSSLASSAGKFPRRGSAGSVVVSKNSLPAESFFIANSIWLTDILTFCSHARADSVLGNAHITQIQARKSHRLPFLHEYLLVFFTAARNQRFVMRIDRLGKVGSVFSGGSVNQQGVAANTAVQEVGIYHVQESQDGTDEPWLAMDGRWGSQPIATLATWRSLAVSGEHVSHHIQTAAVSSPPPPRLKDVSKLLEAILLEMPTYHLTTANCYFMTRSSLLLLQRCYSSSFACYFGAVSNNLIPAAILAEPVWAGLMRWYLPFVILFFLVYIPLLLFFYHLIWPIMDTACSYDMNHMCSSSLARIHRGATYMVHAIFDAPLPVGIMHAYMTSLELQMNSLIVNISTQFMETLKPGNGEEQQAAESTQPPFPVIFDDVWTTLVAWCAIGLGAGLCVFISLAFEYGVLVIFTIALVLGIWFNFKFGDSRIGVSAGQDEFDEMFGPMVWDVAPQIQNEGVRQDPPA